MRISFRDNDNYTKAYIGQTPWHNAVPYPSSPMIPGISDPDKYENMKDYDDGACKKCGGGLTKSLDQKTQEQYLKCSECKGRFSIQSFDKGFGSIGKSPSTLTWDDGSNTNNGAGGVEYHPTPMARDTFSGNLGGMFPHGE